jgi:hypothetical protein
MGLYKYKEDILIQILLLANLGTQMITVAAVFIINVAKSLRA